MRRAVCRVALGSRDCDGRSGVRAEPRARRLLRRDARPHELVARRVRPREHPHQSRRRVQVLQGRADQASPRLRREDRHAARLGGRHRPLRVRGRGQPGERAGLRGQQAPRGAAADPEGQDEGRDGAGRPLRHQHPGQRTAGQGAHVPRDRRDGLEAERRARRPGERAGEVHGLLLLRVDLDAEQHEPAPQHLLQGLRQGAGDAVQRARLEPSRGPLELDGRPAQGRQRSARHLAQRQPLGRPHVPDRGRHQGPPDRRRLRRVARAQRAADRDQAAEGHLRDPPAALAHRRVRELRDHVGPARQPAGPHSAHRRQLRPAGAEGRPRPARTARASTRTSSASAPRRTRTTPPSPTARTTSSAATPSPTGRSRRACPAPWSAACSTRAPKAPRA